MGKRKKAAKKPAGPKKKETLATVFQCLFCNHDKSVTVRLDKKAGVGFLNCKVCGQSFQHQINYLSAAIDVYAEWIDACDAVAKEAPDAVNRTARTSNRDIDVSSKRHAVEDDPGEMDDFIDQDEPDAEADFEEE